ncbi:hypothetical protein [Modestobacter altitudinis]|uniref:hypothetical protein n=1 Tax=Modestobacter altitudinis TaxID=2213158 RepID=UPI00110CE45C|nr:hypothetical protein [Modestobacter altitudinis]
MIVITAAALMLASCGGEGAVVASPTLPPTTDASAPTTSASDDPPTSERGNLVKTLGQEGGVFNPDESELVFTFALDAARADPTCDSGFASPPANGHYLALDLRYATSPNLPEDYFIYWAARDFRFIGADGVTVTNVEGQGFSCSISQIGQELLQPGSQYRGTLILDVPETHGILIYAPAWGNKVGWEWAL